MRTHRHSCLSIGKRPFCRGHPLHSCQLSIKCVKYTIYICITQENDLNVHWPCSITHLSILTLIKMKEMHHSTFQIKITLTKQCIIIAYLWTMKLWFLILQWIWTVNLSRFKMAESVWRSLIWLVSYVKEIWSLTKYSRLLEKLLVFYVDSSWVGVWNTLARERKGGGGKVSRRELLPNNKN